MGRYLGTKVRKTRRYAREPDQILHDDMSSLSSIQKLQNQEMDEERPGLAQFYCIPCARYCESEHALKSHQKSKVHKRRLRELRDGPYTKEEAEMAAGRDVAKYLAKVDQQKTIKINDVVHTLLTPVRADLVQDTEMEITEELKEADSQDESSDDDHNDPLQTLKKHTEEEEPIIE